MHLNLKTELISIIVQVQYVLLFYMTLYKCGFYIAVEKQTLYDKTSEGL